MESGLDTLIESKVPLLKISLEELKELN